MEAGPCTWCGTTTLLAPYNILYATKPDGGSWTEPLNISNGGNAYYARLAADGLGGLHAAWQTDEIWYAAKPAGGDWGSSENLSNNWGYSQNAELAVEENGTAHVVWQDNTPGNDDVYYYCQAGGGPQPTPTPTPTSELQLDVDAPIRLEVVNGRYWPNPFPVTATITNTGGVTATGTLLTITLPVSLTLEGGQTYTQTVGEVEVGQSGVVTWSVTAITQTQDITMTYTVEAGAENTGVVSETREVFVPGVPPPPTPTPTPTPTITPTPTPTCPPAPPLPGAEFKGANYLYFPKEGETYAGTGVGWNLDIAEDIIHRSWYQNLVPGIVALKNQQVYTIVRLGYHIRPPVDALGPGQGCSGLKEWMDDQDLEYKETLAQVSDKDTVQVFILGNEPNIDWGITGQQYAHAYNCYYLRWRWEEKRPHNLYAAGPGGPNKPMVSSGPMGSRFTPMAITVEMILTAVVSGAGTKMHSIRCTRTRISGALR